MKRHLFLSFLIFFSGIVIAQVNIDVLHYKFGIILNDKNDTITGYSTVKFKFVKPASSFAIDLASLDKKGKGMIVDKVVGEDNLEIKNFVVENDKIKIELQHPYNPTDISIFTVYYHGIPDDGLIISKNKFGDRTFFADNWPDRAHHWIPCVDDPADKADFEFIVIAPDQYQVISNGFLVDASEESPSARMKVDGLTRTHWKEDVPLSTKIMVIGVAKFAVKEFPDSPTNIPVTAWVYPKDSVQGFKNYSVAPDIVTFYSSFVGPYPYNKLANVQSTTIYGGMENASAIFYNELSASSVSSVEGLLAHEIAHQWFGDMVSEKKFSHLWLSEGFATYLQHLYTEKKYGSDSMKKEMREDRGQVIDFARQSKNPVVDSVSSFRALLNPNSYQRGSWILHMLRTQVGDSVFKKIIQRFYEQYKGKNADTRDLESVIEEITKKSWEQFFDQWLYTAYIPALSVSWSYSKTRKMINITVEQKQNNPFSFPIEIFLKNKNGKPFIKKLEITKTKETFSIAAPAKPIRVEIDPNTSLLFTGTIQEAKN